MKRLFLILVVLLFSAPGFTQTLVQKWNTILPLGTSGQTKKIIHDSVFTYTSGHKVITGNTYSVLVKINNLTGDTIWVKPDSVSNSLNDLQFCISNGKIFSLSSASANGFFYLIMRDKNTGEMVRIKSLSSRMSFCEYGDSVIAVTSSSSSRVIILNNNGDSVRSFPLGYSLTNGFVGIKRNGNAIWIFGLYYSGGYNSFVEKRNILSGELKWRQNFIGSNPFYGNVDSLGNSYNSVYYLNGADSLIKLDANGNRVWSKVLSNTYDVYPWDVAINAKQNIVLTVGGETGQNLCVVIGKNIITGDSVFSFVFSWNPNFIDNGITGICCDTSGNFYIAGYGYNGPTGCYVRKYYYDTFTGVVIPSEIAENFSLSQNYPNPFNPTTKIKFDVVRLGDVKIVVYDVMGREVQTLVNESLKPGTYETSFDASQLTSGVYFYKLMTEGFTETKKMLLIK